MFASLPDARALVMPQRSLIDVALPRSTSACRRRPTWGWHLARAPGTEPLSWRSSSIISLTDEVPEPDEKHDQPSEHERHDLARFVVVLGLANARPNVVLVTRHDSSCASPVVAVTPCGRSAVAPVLSIARSSGVAARAARSWGMGESEHLYDAADGHDVEDRVGLGDTTPSPSRWHPMSPGRRRSAWPGGARPARGTVRPARASPGVSYFRRLNGPKGSEPIHSTGALGGANCAYRYRPSGRRVGRLYAGFVSNAYNFVSFAWSWARVHNSHSGAMAAQRAGFPCAPRKLVSPQ